jgi:hypothetical protein
VRVSANLGGGRFKESIAVTKAQSWVRQMGESAALLSAVLAITQPDLYRLNQECLIRLSKTPELEARIREWGFAFNVVSVVLNRASPNHRDSNSGGSELFDVLCSIGGCSCTMLELPGLGVRCQYDSGSVAVFSGNLHLHSVSASEKERLCIACYVRQPVHAHVNLGTPGPVKFANLLPGGW